MTAINAMKFNENEGGMVTDSQSSSTMRKYDFADKVIPIKSNGTYALTGGSGHADLLYEATSALAKHFANEVTEGKTYTVSDIAEALSGIATGMKRNMIDLCLKSKFGIDTSTAISGQGVGPHLIAEIKEALTASVQSMAERFNNGFIVIGKDSEGVSLYQVWMGHLPNKIPQPYWAIGSGSDESDKVLCSFVKDQSREGRKNISLVPGMAALIRATNAASEINPGVGGTPTISYFDQKGIVILGEEESKLATELIKIGDARLTSTFAAERGLEALLRKTGSVDEVEREIFKHTPLLYDKIMRFLRGYRG
ncbi:hypothetical protein HZC30_00890 [Candidatus Woesearchaeota archaeon]|nr:hypothetical protein [Candidatus Woesearchaeota archaeon]